MNERRVLSQTRRETKKPPPSLNPQNLPIQIKKIPEEQKA